MHGSPDRRAALPWDDVRLFLALSRSPTVGAAAKQLGVDQSTVSRRLVSLEGALSAKLFERGRDGLAATKAAEDLVAVAEEMEACMLRFTNAADGLEREVSGLVRMTCPPDFAEVLVAPRLRGLLAKHPKLRIEIDPGEDVLDLSRREADLALRTARPTRGDLLVTRLLTIRWVPACAPRLARKLGALKAWSDAPWVSWGEKRQGIGPARWIEAKVGRDGATFRSDSLMMQLSAAAEGVGVALVPEPSARHYGLVEVKVARSLRESRGELPQNDIFLVTHRALRDVPRVRVLWEALVEGVGRTK